MMRFKYLLEGINQLAKVVAEYMRASDRFFPREFLIGDASGGVLIVI